MGGGTPACVFAEGSCCYVQLPVGGVHVTNESPDTVDAGFMRSSKTLSGGEPSPTGSRNVPVACGEDEHQIPRYAEHVVNIISRAWKKHLRMSRSGWTAGTRPVAGTAWC